MRKISLATRSGRRAYKIDKIFTVPGRGCSKGTKTEQDYIVIDMNVVSDQCNTANFGGGLGEPAGRIQQSCNGSLINCSYEFHV